MRLNKNNKGRVTILTLIACLFILGGPQASAQVGEPRKNFSIGGNAGINVNSVSFTPSIKQNTLTGITGGVTLRYISEKYFAMICGAQLEINFSQRGWNEQFNAETGNSYERSMNYIEIPFLAHLAFGKEQRGLQFFINLGPQIGFLISEKETFSDPFNPTHIVTYQYGKMANNKFDYGIAAGLGVELKTRKTGNFLIEGRFYFGLSDFYSNSKKDYFDRSAHSTISVRFSYLFDLIK